ncbi:MAG: hypothetical protein HY901_01315 [Deltaproteobacteria bacterium]|nr:hypothetical protein [Deltaproteobacteria bacterium]
MGAGYALATNDEWQAVARDVEQRADNWSDRSQASGHLNVGNYSYEAGGSLGEDRPCATEGFTERFRRCTDPTSSHFVRKRTHTLSNGAVLWDLAGNVSEWVQGSAPLAPRDFACALRNQDKRTFGPEGDYSSYCPSPNPDGRNLGFVDGSGGTNIFRGSSSGMEGGVAEPMIGLLYANTHLAWSTGQAGPGFRCAFHGPQLRAIAVIQPSRVTVRRFGNQVFRVRGAAATLSLAENSSSATFDPSSGRYLAGRKGGGRDVIRATLSSGQTLDAWVDVAP